MLDKFSSEIRGNVTFIKIWLKYYLFLSTYYAPYFKKVVSKYHSNAITKRLFIEFEDCEAPPSNKKGTDRSSSIPFFLFNARSLLNKINILNNYISEIKPQVIAITETWAKPEMPDGLYTLSGFNLLRVDRCDRRGGGVMIYTESGVTTSRISLESSSSPDFEFACCKLQLSTNVFLGILCIYRPPNITNSGDLELLRVIDDFMALNLSYNIILGDFNMPNADFKSLRAPAKLMPFVECCAKYYLRQHVRESTRPNSNSVLDLIFSTIGTNVHEVSVEECLGSSDHSVINFLVDVPLSYNPVNFYPPKRNYYRADWNLFSKILSDINWDSVFDTSDIEHVWLSFKRQIIGAIQAAIPLRKGRPWRLKSSPKVRTALRYARRCHSIYKQLQTSDSLIKYVKAKAYLQQLINKQVLFFENHIIQSLQDNPKRFWSYVNTKLKSKGSCIDRLKDNNEVIEDPTKMAELFADHFYNCFNHNGNLPNSRNLISYVSTEKTLTNIKIDFNAVSRIVKSLPNKCSEDLDGLSYAVIKGGGDILSLQMCRLFQMSLSTETIPSDWKKSMIYPIKKKTNPKTVNDFRPISITSCICRIFERIIRDAVQRFLRDNFSLNLSQHGFMRGRSTLTTHLVYSNEISTALDHGLCVDCVYFDFSKAFDSVRHDYLIQKLLNIGISGKLLNWIRNYLQNRTQIVNINGAVSTERQVTSGVIQGSVLGPILFTIFVNDIDEHITSCLILKYADDLRIYRSFKSDLLSQQHNGVLFQNDINSLVAWSKTWDMKFNVSKCCILHYGRTNMKNIYKIDDGQIVSRKSEKDLGVIFSNKFKFNEHIETITKKANQKLGIIARVFKNRSTKNIMPLYVALVRPLLEYNSVVWSPITNKYDQKIEKIQRRMLKLLSDQYFEDLSYQQKLKEIKLLSLRARRIQHQLTIMFKMKNNMVDLCFDDFFEKNSYNRTRGNLYKLLVPKSATKMRKGFFSCACVRHWNLLKSSEISVRSCRLFKKSVMNYFRREKIW